ncbi:hypothetical protein [Streptomyces sp. NPDC002994]|uniref:hypothetical protein n=1 Tax=Streptomyces sp. NPDC002994 TaxID=3154441 RepID=UPI0033BD4429
MAYDFVKLIRDITGRYGVTVPTPAAKEIVAVFEGGHQQFTADVMAIWAGWTSGTLTEEDAMAAISDRYRELQQSMNDGGSKKP